MSAEERTKPIRELLAGLGGPAKVRPKHCGGALVPVTRDSFQTMARNLDVDFHPVDIPPEGSVDARVACTNEVLTRRGVGGLVCDATCARCAGIEARLRSIRAEAAARAGR